MDRRDFISQSFVTAGTCALSFSSFASFDLTGSGTIHLRPGVVGQQEFERAVGQATRTGKSLLLHPQTKVALTKNTLVTCSLTSSGSVVEIASGKRLTFEGAVGKELKVVGISFKGETLVKHDGPISFDKNEFSNMKGDGVVVEKATSVTFSQNKVKSSGHAFVLLNNQKSAIVANQLEVSGPDRQFVWAENSFNLVIKDNTLINKSSGYPSIAISNDHDQNPNLILTNNKTA